MTARLTFLAIAAFWVAMNILLWQAEFGSHGGDTPVPAALVWRKILTAPEASSLSVYQNGNRMGFCEVSTSVGQQMAALDENNVPPEGMTARAGNQLHLVGNVALGAFTNRMRFDGRIRFSAARQWRELDLNIASQLAAVEIHSLATNQTVHVKISGGGATLAERDLAFADLTKPDRIIRLFAGGFAGTLQGLVDLPELSPVVSAQEIQWNAWLTHVKLGGESVPVFRVEARVLDRPVVIDVSTLGEILCVELPGGFMAQLDEWKRP